MLFLCLCFGGVQPRGVWELPAAPLPAASQPGGPHQGLCTPAPHGPGQQEPRQGTEGEHEDGASAPISLPWGLQGPFHLPGQDSGKDHLNRLILLSSQGGSGGQLLGLWLRSVDRPPVRNLSILPGVNVPSLSSWDPVAYTQGL